MRSTQEEKRSQRVLVKLTEPLLGPTKPTAINPDTLCSLTRMTLSIIRLAVGCNRNKYNRLNSDPSPVEGSPTEIRTGSEAVPSIVSEAPGKIDTRSTNTVSVAHTTSSVTNISPDACLNPQRTKATDRRKRTIIPTLMNLSNAPDSRYK